MLSGQHRSALAAFTAVSASDFIDGWVAKRFNKKSVLGTYLDPLADKVLIGTMACTLSSMGILSAAATTVVIARDLLLVIGTAFVRYYSMDRSKLSLASFLNVSAHPTHEVRPSFLSKMNTGMQLGWVSAGMLSMTFGVPGAASLSLMTLAVVGTTVASGVHYLRNSRRFLHQMKKRGQNM